MELRADEPRTITREEVHEALASLNDNISLSCARLIAHFPRVGAIVAIDDRANEIRAILLRAIEVLRPPHRLPFGSPASRSYEVLCLRYVSSMSIEQVCEEMSLSRRQVQRDLQLAEYKLADVLNTSLVAERSGHGGAEGSPLGDELTQLATEPSRLRLHEVLHGAMSLLTPLTDRLGVTVALSPPEGAPVIVIADLSVLKQLLVQLLGLATRTAIDRRVTVSTEAHEDTAAVVVTFRCDPLQLQANRLEDLQQIASSQGIQCDFSIVSPGLAEMRMQLRRVKPATVLVVEDNPSAVELYRRYLSAGDWEVRHLDDPRATFEVARAVRPDVIVLDIMMPKMDGWSVLGLLLRRPETAGIPVMVCSVVDEPELGLALGARSYLRKPVSREQFVAAVERCLATR